MTQKEEERALMIARQWGFVPQPPNTNPPRTTSEKDREKAKKLAKQWGWTK